MKKSFLFSVLLLVITLPSRAYDFTASDINGNTIYYTKLGGDSVEVSNNGSTGAYSGDIVIPDNVSDGTSEYRVTTIGANAFRLCTLSSLSVPIGIQEIKNGAFNSSNPHTSLYLPNLRSIGEGAFYGCKYLKKLQMPNLEEIAAGIRTFTDCYDLEEVVLPDELQKTDNLSALLFDSNIMLKGIKLPSNLRSVPEGCFRACWSLKYAILPDSAESIGTNAFLGCIWLKTITIPKKVKTIGDTFICGTALTWQGGAPTDLDRFGGYYLDGLYPGEKNSNQLNSIYFECTTPPTVTSKTFANIIKKNVTCYVPFESVEAYKADSLYVKAFADIVGYHVGESTVDNITANSAEIRWLGDSTVVRYDIDVYQNNTHFAHFEVNGKGDVESSQYFAPSVYRMPMDTTTSSSDYFVISLESLDSGTDYTYTINGTDAQSSPVYHEEGTFTTLNEDEEGFFDAIADDPRKQARKILRDGQWYILHNDRIYNLNGTEMK